MAYTVFKFCFLFLHTHSEGTASQIFHLGLSSHFMLKIGKLYRKTISFARPEGLRQLTWRRLEVSYTFLSRGEGNA